MQLMQILQYSVLTSYSKYASDRIAQVSPQATKTFATGAGGVEDTADKIANLWMEAWALIKASDYQNMPQFKSSGHWPYNHIEVIK